MKPAGVARLKRSARRHARRVVRQRSDPRPNASWVTRPPDFVGIGVQRAGTSNWFGLLERHPQVHPRPGGRKELHYFDRFWRDPFGPDDERAYHELFARPPDARAGEWTPRYLYDPWTVPLLARAAPEARLLVILRDPLARLRSGLAHRMERVGRLDESAVHEAIERGSYHHQLMRTLAHVERERVLVLQFERCTTEANIEWERTLRFLGLDPVPLPQTSERRHNSTTSRPPELSPALMSEVTSRYRDEISALASEFPSIDPSLWPSAS